MAVVQAVDIEIQAKEIMYHKANLNRIMAECTGQPIEKARPALASLCLCACPGAGWGSQAAASLHGEVHCHGAAPGAAMLRRAVRAARAAAADR